MPAASRIISAGIAVADVVVHPVTQPLPLGQVQLVDGIQLHAGGCAMSTATALRGMDLDVELVALVGRDPFGDVLIDIARERGIDHGGIYRLDGYPTSASAVIVDPDGERTFLHLPGCSDHLDPGHIRPRFAGASWLHLAGLLVTATLDGQPAAELLRDARAAGLRTSADVVWDANGRWELIHPCLPHLDVFSPSDQEAFAISGCATCPDAATWFHDHGVEVIAITLGPDGSYVSEGTQAWNVPAVAADARDGTAAGDWFAAGLIAGLSQGWDVPRASALASVLGSIAVSTVGAPSSSGSIGDILRRTDEHLGSITASSS